MAQKVDYTELNIYQRLHKISKVMEVVQKNKEGYGYRYASDDVILPLWKAGSEKYGVLLTMEMDKYSTTVKPYTYTKLNKKTKQEETVNDFIATIPVTFSFFCIDKPEDKLDIPWLLAGEQGDPAQAMGAAMTYGLRYFLLKQFQIATPADDPDSFASQKKAAEQKETVELAGEITDEIIASMTAFLDGITDEALKKKKRDEAITIIKGYEKSGNPKRIKDPDVAAKLLVEITEFANTPVEGEKKTKKNGGKTE